MAHKHTRTQAHIHHGTCSNGSKKAFAWRPMAMIIQWPEFCQILSLFLLFSFYCCSLYILFLFPQYSTPHPLTDLHTLTLPVFCTHSDPPALTIFLFGSIIVKLYFCVESGFLFPQSHPVFFLLYYFFNYICSCYCSPVIWLCSLFDCISILYIIPTYSFYVILTLF